MEDRSLVASVVLRYKQMLASTSDSWLQDASETEVDDAKSSIKDDVKVTKGYLAKCKYLAKVYRNLVDPLMTPAIGVIADKVEKRINDVEQYIGLLQTGLEIAKKAEGEWEALMLRISKDEEKPTSGLIEAVQNLPSVERLYQVAQQAGDLQNKIAEEDEGNEIDWTLEDYLGGEAKVSQRIEKAYPAPYVDQLYGVTTLYGVIALLISTESMEQWLENLRLESDIEGSS